MDEKNPYHSTYQEREERFRSLINRQPAAILILDEEGKIQFANPAAITLFGRSLKDLYNFSFGFPLGTKEYTEVDIIHPYEGKITVGMKIVETVWEGKKSYLVSLVDVSQKVQMIHSLRANEASLIEKANKYTFILEQFPFPMMLSDEQGSIILWNDELERMSGIKSTQVFGKKIWEAYIRMLEEIHQTNDIFIELRSTFLDIINSGICPKDADSVLYSQYINSRGDKAKKLTIFTVNTQKSKHSYLVGILFHVN